MPSAPLHPKLKGLLWLAATVGLAFASVVGFTLGLRQIPRPLEARMGEKLLSFPSSRLCHRPESVQALRKLVARLYPANDEEKKIPVTVEVLRGGPVNAFASLGPRVFVYETLVKDAVSPDELAGVLAHELGHVQERHVLDSLAFRLLLTPLWAVLIREGGPAGPRALEALAGLRYTRAQEYEADVDGLERLKNAGIDTSALSRFFERLARTSSVPALLSDHPSSESRAKLSLLYEVKNPTPALSDEEWGNLRQICRD